MGALRSPGSIVCWLALALGPLGCSVEVKDGDDSRPSHHEPDPDTDTDTDTETDTDTDTEVPVDEDDDGWTVDEDCDDGDRRVHPGAEEICDGVDNDCDGGVDTDAVDAPSWFVDEDADGFGDDSAPVVSCDNPGVDYINRGGDCDDADPAVHPGVAEVFYDGVDSDCDGASDYDRDGDGHDSVDYGGDDCDDSNPRTAGDEWYLDEDGDGFGDDSTVFESCTDPGEGYTSTGGDCGPTDPLVSPLADEVYYDGVDQDCDERSDYDADLDGEDSEDYGGSDCDDHDALVHTDALEICNDADDDCDGLVDDDDTLGVTPGRAWYDDKDGDGQGPNSTRYYDAYACEAPEGSVADRGDCDDSDAAVFAGAAEVCGDAVDNDCDGLIDCEDEDCGDDGCVEGSCDDGRDGDDDGYVDCDDDECWGESECDPQVRTIARVLGGKVRREDTALTWWSDCGPALDTSSYFGSLATVSAESTSEVERWKVAVRSVTGSVQVWTPDATAAVRCAWGVDNMSVAYSATGVTVDGHSRGGARTDFSRAGLWVDSDCPLSTSAFLPRPDDPSGFRFRAELWYMPHMTTSTLTDSPGTAVLSADPLDDGVGFACWTRARRDTTWRDGYLSSGAGFTNSFPAD